MDKCQQCGTTFGVAWTYCLRCGWGPDDGHGGVRQPLVPVSPLPGLSGKLKVERALVSV